MNTLKLVECPRDAMQGITKMIPAQTKADYINTLLKVGFDTIDFGSFVSPKAIPQMKDSAEVLSKLNLSGTKTNLLAIIANVRGAGDALSHPEISCLGFPFSVSETFQKRNTNSTIEESLSTVAAIQNLCKKRNKKLAVYLSMGFGNPYGEEWNADLVIKWVKKLVSMDIRILSLSDTTGVSTPGNIKYLYANLIPEFMETEFGAHLHTKPQAWEEKVKAAWESGCRRFDGALKGFGGCPMAEDKLTGNMPTENMIDYFSKNNIRLNINKEALQEAMEKSTKVFS